VTAQRPNITLGDDGTPASDVAWLWINTMRGPGGVSRFSPPTSRQSAQVLPRDRTRPHEWKPPPPREPFASFKFDEVAQLTADADPRLALSRDTDLLVIGPRRPGLLKSLQLGSTAEWLLIRPRRWSSFVTDGPRT